MGPYRPRRTLPRSPDPDPAGRALSRALQPVLPPLEPGGDYWDTAFLASSLSALVAQGTAEPRTRSGLGRVRLVVRPIRSIGVAGAPKAWPSVRPYDDVSRRTGSARLPGLRLVRADLRRGPRACAADDRPRRRDRATWNPEVGLETGDLSGMVKAAQLRPSVPDSVIAFNCLPAVRRPRGCPSTSSALYADPSSPRAAARTLFAATRRSRHRGFGAGKTARTIGHYLLLPTNGTLGRDEWNALAEYVLVWRPVIGFSISEASLASEVTLVGDSPCAARSASKNDLRAAGCVVRRVIPEKPRRGLPRSPSSAAATGPSILAARSQPWITNARTPTQRTIPAQDPPDRRQGARQGARPGRRRIECRQPHDRARADRRRVHRRQHRSTGAGFEPGARRGWCSARASRAAWAPAAIPRPERPPPWKAAASWPPPWPGPTWSSSPPAWAAAPAQAQRPWRPRSPARSAPSSSPSSRCPSRSR